MAVGHALARLDPAGEPLVAYTGKLIVSKGVDLLLAAWPLVLARVPRARLVIVGFGAYRDGLEEMTAALGRGDLEGVRQLAQQGRQREGGPRGQLTLLASFLERLPEGYMAAAAAMAESVVFTGRLEHGELAVLLGGCDAQVVPSTFPEAFGMVAAEAAACGTLPISAAHSGLVEVSRTLAAAVPPAARDWLSFTLADGAIEELAAHRGDGLLAPATLRAQTRAALAACAGEQYSWQGVARRVLDAAGGRLDGLPLP
jgi:glycosyltransferase involved in cell wall biosynthesis